MRYAHNGAGHRLYALSRATLHLDEEFRATAKQLVADGLAESEGAVVRTILEAATQLTKEEIMGTFYGKAQELMRANPGMTFRGACVELGKRAGAKSHAEAERKRKAEQKAQKYQAELRKRSGERDEPSETGEGA